MNEGKAVQSMLVCKCRFCGKRLKVPRVGIRDLIVLVRKLCAENHICTAIFRRNEVGIGVLKTLGGRNAQKRSKSS